MPRLDIFDPSILSGLEPSDENIVPDLFPAPPPKPPRKRRKRKPPVPETPIEWLKSNAKNIARAYCDKQFNNALRLYRALPKAREFHQCDAHTRMIVGSNQCLAGSERIYDPVARIYRRLDKITTSFHVFSIDPDTGCRIIAKANRPFLKGHAPLVRVRLSTGQSFVATHEHCVLGSPQLGWLRIRDVLQLLRRFGRCHLRSSSGTDQRSFERDVPRCWKIALGSQYDCPSCRCCDDGQLPAFQADGRSLAPSQGDVQGRNGHLLPLGAPAYRRERTRLLSTFYRPSSQGAYRHLLAHAYASETYASRTPCEPMSDGDLASRRSVPRLGRPLRTIVAFAQQANCSAFCEPERQLAEDGIESPIGCFRESPKWPTLLRQQDNAKRSRSDRQPCQFSTEEQNDSAAYVIGSDTYGQGAFYDFEVPQTGNYVHCGIVHHNSGKTNCATAEFARMIRGEHPLLPKYEGIALAVGLDEDHIGQNMWEKLAHHGAFMIVDDEITGAPRAVRPDPLNPKQIDPIDEARRRDWRPAPPFLPPEEWDYPGGIVWRDKARGVPAVVKVRSTGWRALFHPSGGHPRRGISINAAWFDEEIQQLLWFTETMPRLLKANGYFFWSATPQSAREELVKLHRRVQRGEPDIHETQLLLEDNPYITADAKRKFYDSLIDFGDDELAVRYYGQWAILGRQIYPQFDMNLLGVDEFSTHE